MNPFEQKVAPLEKTIEDFDCLYPKSYNKYEVNPYTKTRIILMNGTEFEAVFFSHQFSRNCSDNDLRRKLALIRRVEQQQQKKIANLKPINENILESTIGYEQLAVDLTSRLAKCEPNEFVRAQLDFALLEDFDHLYRYSNLLEMDYGVHAENLVGRYTEIMPARPTIAHHRHPYDSIKRYITKEDELITKLHVGIITAAEQQTMNYYMNVGSYYTSDLGRRLYQEIALVEEEHVSEYGSLMDPNMTWLENLLLHQYTECYLYYSCYKEETDPYIKKVWECFFEKEVAQLQCAAELLEKYEGKSYKDVIGGSGEFPELLSLGPNIEYVRKVLECTVNNTSVREGYKNVMELPMDFDFFTYQNQVIKDVCEVPSHKVINRYINRYGMDYRYEVAENPIKELRNRRCDNVCVGRQPLCKEENIKDSWN